MNGPSDATAGAATAFCRPSRHRSHSRPAVLHGGAIMAFADTLGALATIANLKDGASTTSIESKTNFIGAATVGSRVVGETTPVHRGGRTMVWQTRMTTVEGKLVAIVMQTQLVL